MNSGNLLRIFLFLLFFITACSTTNRTSSSENDVQTIESAEAGVFYSLSDYLRRVPGLQYTNGYFRIRGPQSLNENSQPLYVVDGIIIGNSYDRANNIVDPYDIDHVKVLKDVGSTNKYGMRGSNGVIEIFTKKDS